MSDKMMHPAFCYWRSGMNYFKYLFLKFNFLEK